MRCLERLETCRVVRCSIYHYRPALPCLLHVCASNDCTRARFWYISSYLSTTPLAPASSRLTMLTQMTAPRVRMHISCPAGRVLSVLVSPATSVVQRTSTIPRAHRPITLAVLIHGISASTGLGHMRSKMLAVIHFASEASWRC